MSLEIWNSFICLKGHLNNQKLFTSSCSEMRFDYVLDRVTNLQLLENGRSIEPHQKLEESENFRVTNRPYFHVPYFM